jgi:hypothetical protein
VGNPLITGVKMLHILASLAAFKGLLVSLISPEVVFYGIDCKKLNTTVA